MELLFRQAPIPLAAASAAAIVFAALLWTPGGGNAVLTGWVLLILALNGWRLWLVRRFLCLPEGMRDLPSWRRGFLGWTLFSGALWGSAGVLLLPAEIAYQAAFLLVLGALAAASAGLYAAIRWASACFTLPALLPMALHLLLQGSEAQAVMGGAVLLLVATLLLFHEFVHRSVSASLRSLLDEAAAQANLRHIHMLNEQLRSEIAARERTRASLQQSRERLANAQRIAGFGNWEWDLADDTLEWSEQTYRLFGLEAGSPVDYQGYLARIHPDDRERVKQEAQAAIMGDGRFAHDYRIIRPDGSVRTLHDEGEVRFHEGEPVHVTGVVRDITRRVEAEARTRESERELSRILDALQDTYYRTDVEGRIQRVSPAIEPLLGYRPEECLGHSLWEKRVDGGGRSFLAELERNGGQLRNYEVGMEARDGRTVWVLFNAQYVRDASGEILGIEGTTRDVTEQRKAQEALHWEKERALVTLQSIDDGVITTDREGRIDYLNPVAERLLNTVAAQARGRLYEEVVRLTDEATGESLTDLVRMCLGPQGAPIHVDNGLLQYPHGVRYTIRVSAAPMRDSHGAIIGAVLVLHDITEVIGMARQITYQATHDLLTGLVNRQEFERRLEKAILDAHHERAQHALCYMDLDQFKLVNDTCGHAAGDKLLEQLSILLREQIRDADLLARLGGDEFGLLLDHCTLERAASVADHIRQAVRDFRFVWEERTFEIGISIGVVPITAASGTLGDVLAAVDAACYVAKEQGRNRVHVHEGDGGAVARHHGEMEWVHRLSSAFDEDRLTLMAQAISPLSDAALRATHYEILMRMETEDGRIVPPSAFIPAAERYNLMPTLDRWVVRTTLGKLREAQGPAEQAPLRCAINLSGQSLCDDHFLEFVIDQFEESGVAWDAICFEITETAAIANLPRAMRLIEALRGRGVSFALDDFGSGLSSFAYLKNLKFDYLKIDGAFVRDICTDPVDRAMVQSINHLGQMMGLKTIAEFVENDATVQALSEIGVDFGQGHHIHRPELFDTVLAWSQTALRQLPGRISN